MSNKHNCSGSTIFIAIVVLNQWLTPSSVYASSCSGFVHQHDSRSKSLEPSFLEATGVEPDTIICQTAGCQYKEHMRFNITDPNCGYNSVCQQCPVGAVNSENICHLQNSNPGYINLLEGIMTVSHTEVTSPVAEAVEAGSETQTKDDEKGMIAHVENFTFEFVPKSKEFDLSTKSRQCMRDSQGNVVLAVKFLMQWYKIPGKKKEDVPVKIQLGDSEDDEIVFLQSKFTYLNMGSKIKSMLGVKTDDEDSSSKEDDEDWNAIANKSKASLKKGLAIKNKMRKLITGLKRKFHTPKLTIQFVTTHPYIDRCRQPSSWSGGLSDKSFLFIAQQNISVRPTSLTADFLKKAIQLYVTCKDCQILGYVTCVQVQCPKKLSETQGILYQPGSNLVPSVLTASTTSQQIQTHQPSNTPVGVPANTQTQQQPRPQQEMELPLAPNFTFPSVHSITSLVESGLEQASIGIVMFASLFIAGINLL